MFRTALKILKVSPQDDKETIHSAYTRLVRRFPPEQFPAQFKKVQNAYHELTLSDQILSKLLKEFKDCNNKFQLTAFFCSDHLDLTSTDPKLEKINNLLYQNQASNKVKQILENIDLSAVEYRKVKK
ncbi:MAG: J domain-containing protein [Deltaproteobacteria bacterium]|jgi:DnaJ-class molecular chaperone|nr:J domain-containing protein [Deltaproteobacteria bacterium]